MAYGTTDINNEHDYNRITPADVRELGLNDPNKTPEEEKLVQKSKEEVLRIELKALIARIQELSPHSKLKEPTANANFDDLVAARNEAAKEESALSAEKNLKSLGDGFAGLLKGGDIFVKLDGGHNVHMGDGDNFQHTLNNNPAAKSLATGYVKVGLS